MKASINDEEIQQDNHDPTNNDQNSAAFQIDSAISNMLRTTDNETDHHEDEDSQEIKSELSRICQLLTQSATLATASANFQTESMASMKARLVRLEQQSKDLKKIS